MSLEKSHTDPDDSKVKNSDDSKDIMNFGKLIQLQSKVDDNKISSLMPEKEQQELLEAERLAKEKEKEREKENEKIKA